jgi:hypothetical protein
MPSSTVLLEFPVVVATCSGKSQKLSLGTGSLPIRDSSGHGGIIAMRAFPRNAFPATGKGAIRFWVRLLRRRYSSDGLQTKGNDLGADHFA